MWGEGKRINLLEVPEIEGIWKIFLVCLWLTSNSAAHQTNGKRHIGEKADELFNGMTTSL